MTRRPHPGAGTAAAAPDEGLFGVVLAGGRSSRLHASAPGPAPDKPLLTGPDGRPLLARALEALTGLGVAPQHIVVVGPPDLPLPPGVLRAREDPPFSGPAQAVRAGLLALPGGARSGQRVLLCAADMPAPGPAFARLLAAPREARAAVAVDDGAWQPLLSVLERAAAAQAFAEDARGASVRSRLRRLDPVEVPVPRGSSADVDTWEDARTLGFTGADAAPAPAKDPTEDPTRGVERTWEQARTLVAEAGRRIAADRPEAERREEAGLAEAIGRTLARPVRSPLPAPHFDSSAMDGWAVAGDPPWRLVAEAPADARGENLHRRGGAVAPDEAVPVLTGSLLPEGAEGIVRSEHGLLAGGLLRPRPEHPYRPGRDLRRAGEEMPAGAELLGAGRRVTARHAALFAVCGVDRVAVAACPSVALAVTGNEVIQAGMPGPGEVRDAFTAQLPALLAGWGAGPTSCTRLPDAPGVVERWLDRAEANVVLLTGGSGHSGQDYARRALMDACEEILAESVLMRPGHPTLLGVLPPVRPGSARRPVLALPGNPMAAHAALFSFAPALLAGLLGAEPPRPRRGVLGTAASPGRNPGVRLVPCRVEDDGTAHPLPKGQSHMLSGLAAADALGVIAAGSEAPGDPVGLLPLD
ncbi:NTP transferase domain-containing protein [Rothia kristinae]|uniref:NTP transferase domain-containing protein n=1 Tax=Rothia kristinae TaxID=37923 RepID=UPI0009E52512|nr:NTP transferase domain-containing protein [Rothia kristinae]